MANYEDTASDMMDDGVLALEAAATLLTRVSKNEGLENIDPRALGALLRLIHAPIAQAQKKAEDEAKSLFEYRRTADALRRSA